MIYECLHVYEASRMGRMAADSFNSEKSKAVCVGDVLSGNRVEKVRIVCLGRLCP